jgi:hypothetical protein
VKAEDALKILEEKRDVVRGRIGRYVIASAPACG